MSDDVIVSEADLAAAETLLRLILDAPDCSARLREIKAARAAVSDAEAKLEQRHATFAEKKAAADAALAVLTRNVEQRRLRVEEAERDATEAQERITADEIAWAGIGLPGDAPLLAVIQERMREANREANVDAY